MSWTRRFIYAFWAFVIIMLLWQAYVYNRNISRVDPLHPTQRQFFFYHTNAHAKVSPPEERTGPDVQQVAFTVEDNVPGPSNFTCHVTLRNKGHAKAVNVQVQVQPYRGTTVGDEDVGPASIKPINDQSALAQFGQWVSFPDLAPGETSTQSAVFFKQNGAHPGRNASPQIIFQPEKK